MENFLIRLLDQAHLIWVPNWFKLFSDNEQGGFHERLNNDNQPLDMPKRLLTQCRQVMVYSQALQDDPNNKLYKTKIDEGFQFIIDNYHVEETGGSIFSINLDKTPHDEKYDLYGHAFILLACSAYYNATENPDALKHAETTFNFIDESFTLKDKPGLAESLDSNLVPEGAMRRQNPHMHLMEACIYMYESSQNPVYLQKADEMLELFYDKLLDKETTTLCEFFDDDLNPHSEEGNLVEAGHHAEWVWLLQRYQEVSGSQDPRIEDTKKALFSWVIEKGIDKEHSGVFNVQNRDGEIVDSSKRIWPTLETVRAACIMSADPEYADAAEKVISNLTQVLEDHYIDVTTGNWTEFLTRDLKPETDYRPGTTPYHIFPVLRESAAYLELKQS